jgi:uncharacterized membrane protein
MPRSYNGAFFIYVDAEATVNLIGSGDVRFWCSSIFNRSCYSILLKLGICCLVSITCGK